MMQPGWPGSVTQPSPDLLDADGALKIVGTAVVADKTKPIVDVDDVKLATVAGYIRVNVTDDGGQIADQDYFIPVHTLA